MDAVSVAAKEATVRAPIVRDALVRDLGRMAYEPVWRAMQAFTDARTEETPDEIWLVEHDPVFTLGQAGWHMLPESAQLSTKGADEGIGLAAVNGAGDAIGAVAANKPAAETDDVAPARDGARLAADGNRAARASRPSLTTMPDLVDPPSTLPAPSADAKNRVAQALAQPPSQPSPAQAAGTPGRERAPTTVATPKRAPKRATLARRAKPAPATAAVNAANGAKTPAATKVDCRQPFWIDEGGIRRLKMACL